MLQIVLFCIKFDFYEDSFGGKERKKRKTLNLIVMCHIYCKKQRPLMTESGELPKDALQEPVKFSDL